jgi:glucose-6-phosphate 1-dehydrogenase
MAKGIIMKTNIKLKPTVFAIFGGSGDLTWRKLVPSLFDLFQDLNMPEDFSMKPTGCSTRDIIGQLINKLNHCEL